MALCPSLQKQLCNKYSRLAPLFPYWSLWCYQILQKETLVLRGYKLAVSPARERRFEVLDRRHSEVYWTGKYRAWYLTNKQGKDGDRQGAAPAPGSSRDWLKEQPSWRTMDGQGRALTERGRGHAMGRNGKGMRHQGDNTGKSDRIQQHSLDNRSSQQPPRSHPGHLPMEPSAVHNTYEFAGEPLHCPVNQEGFAMAPIHEGIVPGVVNSSGAAPYIFYQQPVHPAAPYLFYHHGPMPVPYYPTVPYHQPDMVPYSPSPQHQNELVPFYASQPQGETAQFLQPPAWQEISYTVPSLPATPIWQSGDPSMQQYCVYQQQQPPQLVTYGGAPTAHFDPVLAAEQMPQQQMENQGQVNIIEFLNALNHNNGAGGRYNYILVLAHAPLPPRGGRGSWQGSRWVGRWCQLQRYTHVRKRINRWATVTIIQTLILRWMEAALWTIVSMRLRLWKVCHCSCNDFSGPCLCDYSVRSW